MDVHRLPPLWTVLAFTGLIPTGTLEPYCSIQPETIQVEVGGSVTIPCWISFPRDRWGSSADVRVYWRSGRTRPCGDNPYIYNHTENWVHQNYTGRISMDGNPKEMNQVSLRIQDLSTTDGPMFCCRVTLQEGKHKQEKWQNPHGTVLLFPGVFHVYQPDVVPAVFGESTVIPCYVSNQPGEIEAVTWRQRLRGNPTSTYHIVTWDRGNRTTRLGRYSLVNPPNDISLHINDVTSTDQKHYYCEVTSRNITTVSVQGTELVLAGISSRSRILVTQSCESSAQAGDPTTINCSFPSPRDYSWYGIYWRAGNISGPFVYHPTQQMVHPTYRGRTEIKGSSDLHIKNITQTDGTVYYCFIITRSCENVNTFNTKISYGKGTRLRVTGHEEPRNKWKDPITICRIVLFIVLILSGMLMYWKTRGDNLYRVISVHLQ